jgi:hypothetical protein
VPVRRSLVVLLLLALPAATLAVRPPPCGPGLYVVEGAPVNDAGAPIGWVELGSTTVWLPGACGPVAERRRVAATAGNTRLRVTWPTCPGFAGRVSLHATIADDCTLLRGRLRGRTAARKRVNRTFIATRTTTDRWGGTTALVIDATGRFRVEEHDGTWWFVTPDGHGFFSAGVNHLDPDGDRAPALGRSPYRDAILARYGDDAGWADATIARLRAWGFNTVGAFSDTELFAGRFPYTYIVGFATLAPTVPGWPTGQTGHPVRDYFAPEFAGAAAARAAAAAPCAADPWCVGVFTDNELPWGPSAIQYGDYVDAYMTLPAGAPGKLALQAFFAERYGGDVAAFDAVWGQSLAQFDDLQALTDLGSDFLCEPPPRTADRRAFMGRTSTAYYRTVHDAIRAVAGDVLILGSRFLSTMTAPEVIAAAAPWVDVVSVNDYEFDEGARELFRQTGGEAFGYLFLDGPFAGLDAVHALTGRPVMVTEYSFRTPTEGAAVLYPPFFPTFATETERADAYERYQRELLGRGFMVGAHWFQYYDQPATGRGDGENSRFGVVTIDDDPYVELTDRMTALNALAPGRPLALPAFRLPAAVAPLGDRTFTPSPPSPDRTGFYVFILPGQNLATAADGDPLVLRAGVPDANGAATLALAGDAVLGIRTAVGDVACLRLTAAGSSGRIACAGGEGHDVLVTRDAGPAAAPATTQAFLGADSGAGAATLVVPLQVALLPAGATTADCRTTSAYGPPETAALSTATVTVRKGATQLVLAGEGFHCGTDGAGWRLTDGPGMFALGFPTFDPRVPHGDLAAGFLLADAERVCP